MTVATERRLAWITGAGKGIGRAVAKRLVQGGWEVAVSARTTEDLGSLAAECEPGSIHAFPLDVTDTTAAGETMERIERQHGPINLAILNAGTFVPMSADRFSVDGFRRQMETNLMGTVNCLGRLIPAFIERRSGHIAVVASLAGYRGLPRSAAYGASKAGLINMCEALRPELARYDVKLTLINPGFVETPLTERNDFPMPFLIPVEEAADIIVRGLEGSAFEVAFPKRFAWLMKLLRLMPNRMLFVITRRMVR